MLPGDFNLGFEHDFIDMLVELKCFRSGFLVLTGVKIADHIKEFSNIRNYKRIGFLDSFKEL